MDGLFLKMLSHLERIKAAQSITSHYFMIYAELLSISFEIKKLFLKIYYLWNLIKHMQNNQLSVFFGWFNNAHVYRRIYNLWLNHLHSWLTFLNTMKLLHLLHVILFIVAVVLTYLNIKYRFYSNKVFKNHNETVTILFFRLPRIMA